MRPYIFEYEFHRDYLRDMMKWWSTQDSKYSLRWYSKRLGFSSPSMLSMSLSGTRTLPLDKLMLLVDALHLLADEVEFLRIIYDLELCQDDRERERLMTIRRNRFGGGPFQNIDTLAPEYFSSWYLPALRELVAVADFKPDPFWISMKLGITPMEARDGLLTQLRIGQIIIENGVYKRAINSVQPVTPPAVVRDYVRNHIVKSSEIFDIDRNRRYANALTVAVSQEVFDKIPEILARVIAEVDSLAEAVEHRTDLVQLNVQFYSLLDLAQKDRVKLKDLTD